MSRKDLVCLLLAIIMISGAIVFTLLRPASAHRLVRGAHPGGVGGERTQRAYARHLHVRQRALALLWEPRGFRESAPRGEGHHVGRRGTRSLHHALAEEDPRRPGE